MRRCCFDLEVKEWAWGPFVCAVVYDEATDSFHEFLDATETCRFLAGSDVLITFNGLHFDMVILGMNSDPAAYEPLPKIPHLDVHKMLMRGTLEATVAAYAPEIETRLSAYMIERFDPFRNPPHTVKMTKARCDVERTYACLVAVETDPDLPAKIRARYRSSP